MTRLVRLGSTLAAPLIVGLAFACAAAVSVPGTALATTGGVIVSNQNDCSVGPTNVNQLSPGQTAYIWLIGPSTSVKGYTYEITGNAGSTFDTGILKVRFMQCRKVNTTDFTAKFTTPTVAGVYTLTVFDATGSKISSDNFTIS